MVRRVFGEVQRQLTITVMGRRPCSAALSASVELYSEEHKEHKDGDIVIGPKYVSALLFIANYVFADSTKKKGGKWGS